MLNTRTKRRRGLRFEGLERRHLLAGVISEYSTAATNQFLELRGEPNAVLPAGTYVTVVESTGNVLGGRIDTVLDLSGQRYGSNGFLVIALSDHSFTIDPEATALVSATTNLDGLPAGIYQGGDFSVFTATAFLIQSDIPPVSQDDIDTNADGIIDPAGAAASWTIHDSVTIGTIHDYFGYGQTVIGKLSKQLSLQSDSTFVAIDEAVIDSVYYVGRLGDSSGRSADVWVAGFIHEDFRTQNSLRFYAGELSGYTPIPTVFSGRGIDHVGTYNFFGGVRGTAFNDVSRQPLPGLTVLADTNGNGVRDVITTVIEPDNFVAGADMTNAIPGVTLTAAQRNSPYPAGTIAPRTNTVGLASTGTSVFSRQGLSFFGDEGLRVEFYRDADSVQIDAIGTSSNFPALVRMEAFDRSGQSLGVVRSETLLRGQRQTLNFVSNRGEIALVTITEDFGNAHYVNYDRLVVSQKEATATTNALGQYEFQYLTPGSYQITIPSASGVIPRQPVGGSQGVTIDFTEHFDVNFLFGDNKPPVIDVATLEMDVDENAPIGTVIGSIAATDPDTDQTVRYRLVDGTGRRYFALDPSSGEIRVSNPRGLNFELTREYTLVIDASDNFLPSASERATVTVAINNVNDPPALADNRFTVPENASDGYVVGTVIASDQDAINEASDDPESPNGTIGEQSGEFRFAIADSMYDAMFAIDPVTGELSVTDAATFDFETIREFLLPIAVTDLALTPTTHTGTVRIQVLDVNEPPQMDNALITVGENVSPGIVLATPAVFDPEGWESFTHTIIAGSGQALFTMDQDSGAIRLADGASLDFETRSSYDLVVRTVEVPNDLGQPANPLSSESTLSIQVGDIDEPPLVEFTATMIDENAPAGTVVATLTGIDPEGATLTIDQRTGESAFVFDASTNQLRVAAGATIDFENDASHSVLLRVSDASFPPNFTDVWIPIAIGNVNEPPAITTQNLSIYENAAAGTLGVQVVATDPDASDRLRFEIVGGDAADIFGIGEETGVLTLLPAATLDFEAIEGPLSLEVQVTDAGGLLDSKTVEITVLNVNESPVIEEPFANLRLSAGRHFCLAFEDDLFSDPDANTEFEVSIASSSGVLPGWLSYDSATRKLLGTPKVTDVGTTSIVVRINDQEDLPLAASDAFLLSVASSDAGDFHTSNCGAAWQNPTNRFDVNNSGEVAPIDAVMILNFLNRSGPQIVPAEDPIGRYLDVDGDNAILPIDALQVLNYINSTTSVLNRVAAQGEAADATATDLALLDLTQVATEHAAAATAAAAVWSPSDAFADDEEDEDPAEAIDSSLREMLLS
ncbi:Cadherin domain protein [Rosistilla carotiformis]|uniref:Cadherin domain protein n=1 Tax=Rosistilla carotiformis TaxID=2528017 RepID=A0A518JR06_9BACT|nr:cadherin domain-containing protein [Rosistilla carotiformis]QDV67981.1 Cadherin domain protein [Rosistilla carotiformis]